MSGRRWWNWASIPTPGISLVQLQNRISAAETLIESLQSVDFSAAASAWAAAVGRSDDWQTHLDARLGAAAQAEAVRPEADMVAARDLQLASRAAQRVSADAAAPGATTRPVVVSTLKEYPPAIGALRREHQWNRQPQPSTPTTQGTQIHAAAADARMKMARWAGLADTIASPSSTQPTIQTTTQPTPQPTPEELALQASAEAQQRHFDEVMKLDQAMNQALDSAASTQPTSAETADLPDDATSRPLASLAPDGSTEPEKQDRKLDREQVAQAMQRAQKLQQIAQTQEKLNADTDSAKPEQSPALAERQRQVAQAIENARHEPSEAPEEQEPANTRQQALMAIQQAQERLAEMPEQLTAAQQAATVRRDSSRKAEAARREAATAPADRQPAAQRAAGQAERDLAEAVQRSSEAAKPVHPDVAESLSASLSTFAPETADAVEAIEQQLAPSLRQMDQAAGAQDVPGVDRAAASARQAIEQVQKSLRAAQDRVNERDPILAAKWFAQQAVAALSRQPPNPKGARQHQQKVSQSLAKAQDRSLQKAKGGRLAQTPLFSPLYRFDLWGQGAGVADGSLERPAGGAPVRGQWGKLRQHEPSELNTSARDADPPGYQEALKAYFEALGKAESPDRK